MTNVANAERVLLAANLRVCAGEPAAPRVLVERLDLDIRAGQIVAIIGETGTGKTMSMLALLGILPRGVWSSGTLSLGEEEPREISTIPLRRRADHFGTVLQHPHGMFDPLLRLKRQIVEQVTLSGAMNKREALDRARSLLTQVGIRDAEHVLRQYCHEFSGGIMQRVAVASALMPSPRVLVADEPTSALDSNLRVELLRLFRRLSDETGLAALLITHDLDSVARVCDRIHVMYGGRVVERGTADEVLNNPQHPYTRGLLACKPSIDSTSRQRLPVIPGQPPMILRSEPGCPFRARCPEAFERCAAETPILMGRPHATACHRVEGAA